ncbi:Lrp/AsnC family transcriptional regulator [Yinghuangia sp. KLBMP8922]|uniref:Lrp/AsnC family transcriptional regulator n=1 Tax=Yinghuangia soli TaxID=2908204 RepID=A0AA41U353_9ACTN|nr:Lrp/AsnC family transcriptional regulator [Yinghuangia soli]
MVALADRLRLSRNTVQARLAKLEHNGALGAFDRRVSPAALGYPLTAIVTAQVDQRRLAEVAAALAGIDEVVEVIGLSGGADVFIKVAARDAEDLYRIAGRILAAPAVERTSTALAMQQLVPERLTPLLRRAAQGRPGRAEEGQEEQE